LDQSKASPRQADEIDGRRMDVIFPAEEQHGGGKHVADDCIDWALT
jgi:hypothetical protein